MSNRKGWIGVDLDGTLAYSVSGNKELGIYHIGPPIPAMVERVKKWLEQGREVRVMTARAVLGRPMEILIEGWCLRHIGQVLPVTDRKDFGMAELWDDRAIQVIENTGEPILSSEGVI